MIKLIVLRGLNRLGYIFWRVQFVIIVEIIWFDVFTDLHIFIFVHKRNLVLEDFCSVVVNQVDQFKIHICDLLHKLCELFEVVPVEASGILDAILKLTLGKNVIKHPLEIEIWGKFFQIFHEFVIWLVVLVVFVFFSHVQVIL